MGVTGLVGARLLGAVRRAPAAVAGHSYGEYVALCVAGTRPKESVVGCRPSAARSSTTRPSPGAMAAVAADGRTTAKGAARWASRVCRPISTAPIRRSSPARSPRSTPRWRWNGWPAGEKDSGLRRLPYPGHGSGRGQLGRASRSHPVPNAPADGLEQHDGPPYPADRGRRPAAVGPPSDPPGAVRKTDPRTVAAGAGFFGSRRRAVLTGPGRRGFWPAGSAHRHCPRRPGRAGSLQLAHLLAQCSALGLPVERRAWFSGAVCQSWELAELCARGASSKCAGRPIGSSMVASPGRGAAGACRRALCDSQTDDHP